MLIEKVAVVVGLYVVNVLPEGLFRLLWNVITWFAVVEPLVDGPDPLANSMEGWASTDMALPPRRSSKYTVFKGLGFEHLNVIHLF